MSSKTFNSLLLSWYDQHKRAMPWRGIKEPYIIWLSEVILQQTRVAQGQPYFERFLKNYPSVTQLANASEIEVLKLWEGLGYYSRARNLHKAAKYVTEVLKGQFPLDYTGLLKLPGVGPYTAAAIASICYDEKVVVIDGNVNRLASRLLALEQPVDTSLGRKAILAFLEPYMARCNRPGDFNQALMEFGAEQCSPRTPSCHQCPLSGICASLKLGSVESFPRKKSKTKVRDRFLDYYVLLFEDGLYIRQRPATGIWGGLYEFYLVEKSTANEATKLPWSEEQVLLQKNYVHTLSHQRIHAQFLATRIPQPLNESEYTLVSLNQLDDYPMARISTRFLEENPLASIHSGH